MLELDDILLYPAPNNRGIRDKSKYNFFVMDELDRTGSFPIFTAPSDSIVDKKNYRVWTQNGIKPVFPRSESIDMRLEACQYIFTAFSLEEIKAAFISSGKRISSNQFKICIEEDNGENIEIFNVCLKLKQIYGPQINIMAGNIGNPKTYIDYCKAGIDYVRVGLGSCSLVDEEKYGFYYPMASLLLDITGLKATSCTGLKQTKIIADGGISNQVDILKALALGADYVMLGRQFTRLIEAAGTIYRKEKGAEGMETLEEINPSSYDLASLSKTELKDLGFQRLYTMNSFKPKEARSDWVKVTSTIDEWKDEAINVFSNAFLLSDATNWREYKTNIKFCRVQ